MVRSLDSTISNFIVSIDCQEKKNPTHMDSRNQIALKMKAELTAQGNFYYVHWRSSEGEQEEENKLVKM